MAAEATKSRREYNRRWRHENLDKVKAQRERHREKRIKQKRKWYETVMSDPERRKQLSQITAEYHRRKRTMDPDYAAKSKARANRYHEKRKHDPEYVAKIRERAFREYQLLKSDPGRYTAYLAKNREHRRNRKLTDPDFAIRCHLRARLSDLVRHGRCKRMKSAVDLTGTTITELRIHLEEQFKRGMSWTNYGKGWHIDHIIPCSEFDLTDPRQQAVCFNYLNLRPCWAKENMRKSNRILEDSQLPLGI